MIKILTEDFEIYKSKSDIELFKKYFLSRYSQLRKILIEKLRDMNKTTITISNISENITEYTIIARIFEITENKTTIFFKLDDPSGVIDLRYFKNPNQTNLILITDIVLAFTIKNNVISQIIFPDVPSKHTSKFKKRKEPIYAVLISDVHVGSKNFISDKFNKFIDSINEIENLKYLIIGGDTVDGVGVYPGQEYDLELLNIDDQYKQLAQFLTKLKPQLEIIIAPGNHDYLPIEEPQKPLNARFTKYFEKRVTFIANPCLFEIENVTYLLYHGRGADSLLAAGKFTLKEAQQMMKYLIKIRHLSPMYDSKNTNFILEKDCLVIDRVPDVFQTGHIHKKFILPYKGILVCNSGCWQEQTEFQKRMDIDPDKTSFVLLDLNNLELSHIRTL